MGHGGARMSSLRLEEKPFEVDGKVYLLRCNMAVLDALQEAHGGDCEKVAQLPARDGVAEILAAMLNDYAEDMNWEERWTPRQIKKRFSYAQLVDADIFGIFWRGTIPQTVKEAQPDAQADEPEAGN